jgi:hypothetical protein
MTIHIEVSIVIPTLGQAKIIKVLRHLNQNSNYKISEIILSIPRNKYNHIKSVTKTIDNVKLVCNIKKSQVLQRINGFKEAKEKNVLQLDDDTFISSKDINLLKKKVFGINKKIAAAPIFKTLSNKYLHNRKNNFLYNIHYYIITLIFGSIKKINKFGTFDNCLISFKGNGCYKNLKDSTKVEWTLGGCLMHKKKNLILKNYYPFLGKSFFEDVLHSLEIKGKGVDLYLIKNASAYCKREESIKNFNDLINYLRAVKFFAYKTQMGFFDKFRKIYIFFIYRLMRLMIKN